MRANEPGLLAVLMLVGACQTYDMERVEPLTVIVSDEQQVISRYGLKPNVMLLVDNSGSMNEPSAPDLPACGGCLGDACPATCPTRARELKQAMHGLLTTSGSVARLGLAIYPDLQGGGSCAPTSLLDEDLPPATVDDDGTVPMLEARALAIDKRIQTLFPAGGTPTNASLRFVGELPSLNANDGRDDFVLLLTDGVPNCNDANPNNLCGCYGAGCSMSQLSACACTGTTSAACTNASGCSLSCLDQDGTSAAIQALRQRGIRTIVVGFGADVQRGKASAVLNAMAAAGGFERPCRDLACDQQFYAASNAAELSAALGEIWCDLPPKGLCHWTLKNPPDDPRFIAVLLNGEDLPPGGDTWLYHPQLGEVELLGEPCQMVLKSTTQRPVKLEIRSVRKL